MKSSLIALASALIAPPVLAQTVQDRREGWTPEDTIVVTGTRDDGYTVPQASTLRTPVPILNTPQSVQVLTRKLIEDQQLITLDEALANVSGVVPSLASEIVLANPIVRGFEAEIFTDGMIGYGDTAVSDPSSLWHVERVEVAKGPTSTLFGGGTGAPVGGLINMVSKTANMRESFAAQGRVGSFATYGIAGDANLPFGNGAAVRLIGEYQNAGDAIDRVDIDRVLLAPSFRIRPTPDTDIVARLTYSRVKQREYAGLPAQFAGDARVDRFRFTGSTLAPPTRVENVAGSLEVTHKLSSALTANVRVRRYASDFDEFASTPFFAVFPCTGTVCPQIPGRLGVSVREWTGDASLAASFKTGTIDHVLIGGVQYDATAYNAGIGFGFANAQPFDYALPGSDIAFVVPTIDRRQVVNRYRTLAAYIQNQATIADRLHILASLRYSRLQLREIAGGAGNNTTYHEIDPRLGVSLDVAEGVALFAGYATGSRLSIFFNGANSPLPERSKSFEGGVKFGLKEIGLSGTIASFSIERTNVPTPDPTTFFTSIQTGKQRSQGVEADLIYEPSRAFSLLASYAYTDAKVVRDTLIPRGARLPRVPEHRGRLAARYRVLDGGAKGLEFGAGLTGATGAFMALPNGAKTASFVVADAQASYQVGPATVGVRVDNLFNRRYFLPYQYFAQDVVRPGNPRSAYVTVNFGL